MKFIDKNKYSKIKELADKGDEKAKDFLFNFMTMDDEKANEYLSSISFEENEWENIINDLIKDENEAIDGYDKAIKYLVNTEENPEFLATLQHIKDEEIEHIEELKGILNNSGDKEQENSLNIDENE